LLICFPDDHHIVSTTNITFRQARIKPGAPILTPEFSWELPRTNLYGSVFKSVNGYEMYYQCGNAVCIAYAISADGIKWEKPLINLTDFSASVHDIILANNKIDPSKTPEPCKGGEPTNLVAGFHMPSIIYEPESQQPYKIFAFGDGGYHTLYSQNGKQFTACSDNPAISLLTYVNPVTEKTWCSDVAPCFKDRTGYTAMVKTYLIDDQNRTRRCVGRSTSQNFRDWGPVTTVWEPGESEDAIARTRGFAWADFYGLCPFPYGSGYLGFLWLFEIEKELPRGTNLGKIEVFLAYSPDGKQWRRIEEQALLPWDLNYGKEGGMVTTPSAPIYDDDEIKLYYSDSNYEHGFAEKDFTKQLADPQWVIRCARLPKERLVGAYSDSGSLELTELCFKGQGQDQSQDQPHCLRLNVACENGSVRLEYKRAGQLLSTQLVEHIDSTDHLLDIPVEGYAVLLITLHKATLYAIEFI
jgi:hypothetical protein